MTLLDDQLICSTKVVDNAHPTIQASVLGFVSQPNLHPL
jgi:hypothetical protein